MKLHSKNSFKVIISATLAFTLLFNCIQTARACSFGGGGFIFSYTRHAANPMKEYLNGNLGVVPKSFGRMSLFVFYRELNGMKLSQNEQNQIREALDHRIENAPSKKSDAESLSKALDAWTKSRSKVSSEKLALSTDKDLQYSTFANCPANAFSTASNTLDSRLASFGNSSDVKEWLAGQDAVFSNCSTEGKLPVPAAGSSPEWLRQDRSYQIAAAKFYASDYVGAREGFKAISADTKSPWKSISNYLIARTYIRQASMIETSTYAADAAEKAALEKRVKEKAELLKSAEKQLTQIISDSESAEQKQDAKLLLNLVKYRLDPVGRQTELSNILLSKSENLNIFNDLTDYIWQLDRSEYAAQENPETAKLAAPNDDLSDWLYTYQQAQVDSFPKSLAKWKETGSLAWFVSAIVKSGKNSAEVNSLLQKADSIKSDSPAFATVRYHQIRLLIEQEKRSEAIVKLGDVDLSKFEPSTKNKFLSLKMTLAKNVDEFLINAKRMPADYISDSPNESIDSTDTTGDAWKGKALFDEDSVDFINTKIPLALMRDMALSKEFPEHLKKSMVNAVWTRAVILGNSKIEKEFTPLMKTYVPDYGALFERYASSTTVNDSESARLLLLLRATSITPYINSGVDMISEPSSSISSGSWWCNLSSRTADSEDYAAISPDFLSPLQVSIAAAEQKQMTLAGESATFLTKRVITFAKANPKNPNTPELLYLAVRSTRFGCSDKETRTVSKQAFDILHKGYPGNQWTKKTPYYYGTKEDE